MATKEFKPNATFARRFWAKVNATENCWLWTGPPLTNGYGQITVCRRVRFQAHRASWIMHRGPIPDDCVNPDHLFIGTPRDNMQDALNKGRMALGERNGAYTQPAKVPRGARNGRYTSPEKTARGERHGTRTHPEKILRGEDNGFSKLTESDVRAIRQMVAGGMKQTAVARQFGICKQNVGHIIHRLSWRHV